MFLFHFQPSWETLTKRPTLLLSSPSSDLSKIRMRSLNWMSWRRTKRAGMSYKYKIQNTKYKYTWTMMKMVRIAAYDFQAIWPDGLMMLQPPCWRPMTNNHPMTGHQPDTRYKIQNMKYKIRKTQNKQKTAAPMTNNHPMTGHQQDTLASSDYYHNHDNADNHAERQS